MASQKHLKDLLQEDQEPFKLKSFISDRKCQIKRGLSSGRDLQVKKRKPISQNSNFTSNLRKNTCFFRFNESPDPRKSPLFGFSSPCKNPNGIFINIPARTASLLLEAAVRVQKQSSDNRKTKKGNGFGLLGSVLKKLTHRKKREIDGNGVRASVKDILRWDPTDVRKRFNADVKSEKNSKQGKTAFEKSAFETCSCNERLSSAAWSESKSLEETPISSSSSSSQSDGSEYSDEFITKELDGGDLGCYENQFCQSPFHFVLQTSPSPDLSPLAQSPSRRVTEKIKELQEDEEEEGKEQCSPVSVLDPVFEDEDDGAMDDYDKKQSCDIESSYAAVQRAKHQLLQKLCRFEKLAGLDPIELEKQMSNEEEHEEQQHQQFKANDEELVEQVLESKFQRFKQTIPDGIKRLVFDLIAENEQESAAKTVCGRLDSWEGVESNTIDMMVEDDYRNETFVWKENQEEVHEAALQIEVAIFGCLVGELSEEFRV